MASIGAVLTITQCSGAGRQKRQYKRKSDWDDIKEYVIAEVKKGRPQLSILADLNRRGVPIKIHQFKRLLKELNISNRNIRQRHRKHIFETEKLARRKGKCIRGWRFGDSGQRVKQSQLDRILQSDGKEFQDIASSPGMLQPSPMSIMDDSPAATPAAQPAGRTLSPRESFDNLTGLECREPVLECPDLDTNLPRIDDPSNSTFSDHNAVPSRTITQTSQPHPDANEIHESIFEKYFPKMSPESQVSFTNDKVVLEHFQTLQGFSDGPESNIEVLFIDVDIFEDLVEDLLPYLWCIPALQDGAAIVSKAAEYFEADELNAVLSLLQQRALVISEPFRSDLLGWIQAFAESAIRFTHEFNKMSSDDRFSQYEREQVAHSVSRNHTNPSLISRWAESLFPDGQPGCTPPEPWVSRKLKLQLNYADIAGDVKIPDVVACVLEAFSFLNDEAPEYQLVDPEYTRWYGPAPESDAPEVEASKLTCTMDDLLHIHRLSVKLFNLLDVDNSSIWHIMKLIFASMPLIVKYFGRPVVKKLVLFQLCRDLHIQKPFSVWLDTFYNIAEVYTRKHAISDAIRIAVWCDSLRERISCKPDCNALGERSDGGCLCSKDLTVPALKVTALTLPLDYCAGHVEESAILSSLSRKLQGSSPARPSRRVLASLVPSQPLIFDTVLAAMRVQIQIDRPNVALQIANFLEEAIAVVLCCVSRPADENNGRSDRIELNNAMQYRLTKCCLDFLRLKADAYAKQHKYLESIQQTQMAMQIFPIVARIVRCNPLISYVESDPTAGFIELATDLMTKRGLVRYVEPVLEKLYDMFLKAAFGATLIAVVSAAVLPARNTDVALEDIPGDWGDGGIFWQNNLNTTEEDVEALSNAWTKLKLRFPITIFNKTSDMIYISINGIISLDKPVASVPTTPEQPLPVDPLTCSGSNSGVGCIPGTSILPFWRALSLRPRGDRTDVEGGYTKPHSGLPMPHYHLYWSVCETGVPTGDGGRKICGNASRYIGVVLGKDEPGIIRVFYPLIRGITGYQKGVIGIQSYPDYLSIPVSEVFDPEKNIIKDKCPEVVFDTVARKVTVNRESWCAYDD
ncbi:hypothetical protein Dda_8239 [Drechslerella dactyloides]|uniref:Clr5 domain-containing protein n=1 Tax=Drechslerella dactyloides TaxID=74499 RepID=A0AAD6NGF0_DREDA|nr:hypothetical protein Dda_8239 [Drechslerella dactyloides]